ncbi:hypothetical protein EC396_01795 [Lutibacter sp. HS1-25]|uniref:hypothetical protein n=1 Tax=Lutibacter sp. HS1-25 TaxID=2485000 RepID=UPI001011513D|nr:hypothetical protein [Lutibacter sp. HS1-25]RXP63561.1 hypothetical protein EC396_01795 [Lutibacter sp. HS1-25]
MNSSNPPKNFIKTLQIIHLVLLLGVLIFASYVAFSVKEQVFFSYSQDKAFLYLAILISFIGNLSSKTLFGKLLKQIPVDVNLNEKLVKYSTAHIFRIAMLEFPALMCCIFVLYSNNSFYFILVGILSVIMLVLFPIKYKLSKELELTDKEKSMLEKL